MKKGVAVITKIDNDELEFGEVTEILISRGSKVWLGLHDLDVLHYDYHFHSWAVKKTDKTKLTSVSLQILPIRPARYASDFMHFITLKYAPS